MSTFKGFFFSLPLPSSSFLINHRDTTSVSTLRRTEGGMYLNPNIYGWRCPRRSDHATFTGEDAKSPLYGATQRKKKKASRWVSGLCFQPLINKCRLRLARPGPDEVRLAQWSSASLWKSAPSQSSTLLSVSPPHTLLWLAALAGATGNFWCNTAPSGPECPCTHRHACSQMQRAPSVQLRTDAALGRQGQKIPSISWMLLDALYWAPVIQESSTLILIMRLIN